MQNFNQKVAVPEGVWVSVAGLYRPGKISSNQFNQAVVALESCVEPQATFSNSKPRREVIRRFAPTILDLKEKLIREFGNKVSFSVSDPQSQADPATETRRKLSELRDEQEATANEIFAARKALAQKYLPRTSRGEMPTAEITWEKCQATPVYRADGSVTNIRRKVFEAILAEEAGKQIDAQVAEHRAISLEVPEAELEGLRQRNIDLLKTQSGLAAAFNNKSDFFSWENGWNLAQVYAYCKAHEYWPIPLVRELEEACRYLDAHKHFAERTYKRSEQFMKPVPYRGADLITPSVSAEQIVQAKNKLALIYGRTAEITLDKALRAGVSEQVFSAIVGEVKQVKDQTKDKSGWDLQEDMRKQRNARTQ
jgi:hypothetical protein